MTKRKYSAFSKSIAMLMAVVMALTSLAFLGDVAAYGEEYAENYIVKIEPGIQLAKAGTSLQFVAVVETADGEIVPNPDVKWSVVGFWDLGEIPVSSGTTISDDGLLVIADGEIVPGMTIMAAYEGANSFEYLGTAAVILPENEEQEEEFEVEFIGIQPANILDLLIYGYQEILSGREYLYSARILLDGTQEPVSYTWSLDETDVAVIVGSTDAARVTLRGLRDGEVTLRVTAEKMHLGELVSMDAELRIEVSTLVAELNVSPRNIWVKQGAQQQFATIVEATPGANTDVVWSVIGAGAGTAISADGLLTVAESEPVGAIRVRATLVANPDKYAEANVVVSNFASNASPNGFYHSIHRNPWTGGFLALEEEIPEFVSTGVWGRMSGGSVTGGFNYDWSATSTRYGTDTRYVYEGGYGDGNSMFTGNQNNGSNFRLLAGNVPGAEFAIYEGRNAIEPVYANIDFTFGMSVPANQQGAVVFRYQDYENFYYFRVTSGPNAETRRIELGKVVEGVDTVLRTNTAVAAAAGTWYAWLIRLEGNNISVRQAAANSTFRFRPRWAAGDTVMWAAGTAVFTNVVLDEEETFDRGRVGLWAVDESAALYSHVAFASLDNNFVIRGEQWALTTGSFGNIRQLTADSLLRGDPATTAAAALRDDPNGGLLYILGNDETNRDQFGYNKHMGELRFAYKMGTGSDLLSATTGDSEDIRRAVFNEQEGRVDFIYNPAIVPSQHATGIRNFSVVNSYSLGTDPIAGEFVQLDIRITNTSDVPIEFYDIGMPISWNNHWAGDSAYKFNVGGANNFVAYHGTYITVERNDGRSQKVVFMPDQNTEAKFEYRRFQSTMAFNNNMPEEFFIYSMGVANRAPKELWANNNYQPDQSYLPNTTSGQVLPGEERHYGFRIFITDEKNHLGIDDILVSQGSVAPVVKPGLVTPIGQAVEINLRTISDIIRIEDITPDPDPRNGVQIRAGVPNPIAGWYAYNNNPRAIVTPNAAKTAAVNAQNGNNEANIYDVTFRKLGRNDLKVFYEVNGEERWTVLQFWVIEDVADAIQRRADFHMDHAFVTQEFIDDYLAGGERRAALNAAPDDHYNTIWGVTFVQRHKYAFLETNNIFGYVRAHNGDNFYCTNSVHEQHTDNVAFLANKNIYYPVARELQALEKAFIDHFYALQVRNFGSPQSTGNGSAGHEGDLWAGCGCYGGSYWGSTGTTAATSRITRSFNYQNLAAAFWSMYEATRRNPEVLGDDARWEPIDYLKVAAILAYRGGWRNPGQGHMNDWSVHQIYASLRREAALIEAGIGSEGTVAEPTRAAGLIYRSAENLADFLRTAVERKGNQIFNAAFPFASEFGYDNTGEEGAYSHVKFFATGGAEGAAITRLDKMAQTIGKTIAWLGKQPLWYQQSTGRPMGGDWWMFQYSTGHQSQIINDFFLNHADSPIFMTEGAERYEGNNQFSQDMWRFVFPMKFASFVWIQSGQPEIHGPWGPTESNPTGGLVNQYPMRDGFGILGSSWGALKPARPYDWSLEDSSPITATNVPGSGSGNNANYNGFPYTESAESDFGLWGGLNSLSADVVPNDPNFGLAGWGAIVTETDRAYHIIPTDGLFRRLNIVGDLFQVEFMNDRYTEATIRKDYRGATFEIENFSGAERTATVNLRNLRPGTYNVIVDGVLQSQVVVPELTGPAAVNFGVVGEEFDRFGVQNFVSFEYETSGAPTQTLEIVDASLKITSLRINQNAITRVARNTTLPIELIVNEGACIQDVVLTVSNPEIASIGPDGSSVIAYGRAGTVTLTASDPETGLRHSVTLMIT